MEIDLNQIIQTVLAALLPIIAGFAAAWLRQWVIVQQKKVESEIGEQWSWAIKDAVKIAVNAAEQSELADLIKKEVGAKKSWAIESARRQLLARGIDINVQVIADLIEAAVFEAFKTPDTPQITTTAEAMGKVSRIL